MSEIGLFRRDLPWAVWLNVETAGEMTSPLHGVTLDEKYVIVLSHSDRNKTAAILDDIFISIFLYKNCFLNSNFIEMYPQWFCSGQASGDFL